MTKILTSIVLFCLFSVISLSAQTDAGQITGKVTDDKNAPVAFANVLLFNAVDSTLVKAEYTTEEGNYQFSQVPEGRFRIAVSYVGYADASTGELTLRAGGAIQAPAITLASAATELNEVVVAARKPLIEVRPDKTVFNVEGSINAVGNTAFELLRKSPGVVVDNNDNIILQGKNGVNVYIDGRPSPLTSADLAALLKTIQSSEIEAIEIITQPSSKYDAAGNAGIINIRMRRDKRLGANASLELGFADAIFPKYNGAASLNYRDKTFNVFGKYSLATGNNWSFFNLYREQSGQTFDQQSTNQNGFTNHNIRAGADFFIGKHHTVGVLATGFLSDMTWDSKSKTLISEQAFGNPLEVLDALSENDGKRDNLNANINYRFDNTKGIVWNVDADYGVFRLRNEAFQPNYYRDPFEGNILEERIFATEAPTDIDITTFKIDHERPLLGGQLGVGVKTSLVSTDNIFNFYNVENEEYLIDPERTNQFLYDENINAAYVNYQRQAGKWGFQGGLRLEHTHSDGRLTSASPTGNDKVERDYADLFPSAGITYNANEKNALRLNYSRRIDRPRYQDLNPFEYKLDELTYQRGNPFLRPQYSNSLELGHTYNYMLNTSIGFTYTTDLMTALTDTTEVSRSYITEVNLASQRTWNFNISYPFAIAKWWNTYTNFSGFNTRNQADFGEGKTIDISVSAFSIYSQHTFQLPWNVSLELSGFYNSPSIWGSNFRNREFWAVETGVQKKVLQGRGNLKASVSDVFLSSRWRGVSEYGGLYTVASGGWESRLFRLNFTYNIGNQEVKAARRRNTGLEDEQKRVKSEN
ncbi:MAG: TonB-dependent receptor [Saprospiraceae bacterium]|nr:TonB-dependent receptor [Saprospiraceae bacterium]